MQINGNNNTVNIGRAYIRLTRFLTQVSNLDLERLNPFARFTSMTGRQTELADLQSFLRSPRLIAARVLVGGAGVGKTRLALELCDRATADGWDAGFVTGVELQRFIGQTNVGDWGWGRPCLIAVDNASSYARLLRDWFDELTNWSEPPAYPLRFILIDRHADTDQGWWHTIFACDAWESFGRSKFPDPVEPVEIFALATIADRVQLVRQVVAKIDSVLNLDDEPSRDVLSLKLAQQSWAGDPLFLMMAATYMCKVGHANVLSLGPTDLAKELAEIECGRLSRLADASHHCVNKRLAVHLAACITLAQGVQRTTLEAFANQEVLAIGRSDGLSAASLMDFAQEGLGGGDNILPVQPDMIGEALILKAMRGELGTLTVIRCFAEFGMKVAEVAIRCAQDFGSSCSDPIVWLTRIVDVVGSNEDQLRSLSELIPSDSLILRDVNLTISRRLYSLTSVNATFQPFQHASAALRLASVLGFAGKHKEARGAAQEATGYFEAISKRTGGVIIPDHALAYNELSIQHAAIGEYGTALRAGIRAVRLFKVLSKQNPDEFSSKLAGSLSNLANLMSDVGRHDSALRLMRKSVALYMVAVAKSLTLRPELALALCNLSNKLEENELISESLGPGEKGLSIYRELAAERPDIFEPRVAMALTNLSNKLCKNNHLERAIRDASDAVLRFRRLAQQHPNRFTVDLALSLINLTNALALDDRRDVALESAAEALELCQRLRQEDRSIDRLLVSALMLNVELLIRDGHTHLALPMVRDALSILGSLTARFPQAYMHMYEHASSLLTALGSESGS